VLFTTRCAKAGIEVSMGSVGDCYDNAVCETFHASLKKERIYRQSWPTRAAARTAIFQYIEGWYRGRDAGCPAPPAQIPASASNALGSYREWLAWKRVFGQGCRIRGRGSHRSASRPYRSQVIRWR
jgi:hypothetical protein